jgi:hypothetical protein
MRLHPDWNPVPGVPWKDSVAAKRIVEKNIRHISINGTVVETQPMASLSKKYRAELDKSGKHIPLPPGFELIYTDGSRHPVDELLRKGGNFINKGKTHSAHDHTQHTDTCYTHSHKVCDNCTYLCSLHSPNTHPNPYTTMVSLQANQQGEENQRSNEKEGDRWLIATKRKGERIISKSKSSSGSRDRDTDNTESMSSGKRFGLIYFLTVGQPQATTSART